MRRKKDERIEAQNAAKIETKPPNCNSQILER